MVQLPPTKQTWKIRGSTTVADLVVESREVMGSLDTRSSSVGTETQSDILSVNKAERTGPH